MPVPATHPEWDGGKGRRAFDFNQGRTFSATNLPDGHAQVLDQGGVVRLVFFYVGDGGNSWTSYQK